MRFKRLALALLPLTLFISARPSTAQSSVSPPPRLFVRYEGPVNANRAGEAILRLRSGIDIRERSMIALRVCSQDTLPVALADAFSPFGIAEILWDSGYRRDRVIYLLSGDCAPASGKSSTPPVEIWAIPEGGAMPPSSDRLRSDQISLTPLGKMKANRGVRDYRAALRQLIRNLQAKPANVGVVYGFFLQRPSPALRRRMREAAENLRRSGLRRSRYIIDSRYWPDEVSIFPPDKEPTYPDILVVEVERDANR